jgi:hypothetical protein
MTLRPGTAPRRGKGKPEGSVVTGKTRKLWVAEMSLVFNDAAGQNNSNLASLITSVVNDGWELILAMSSHYCFIAPALFLTTKVTKIFHKDHKVRSGIPLCELSACFVYFVVKGFQYL